jgi:hypothetical protein
VRVQPTVVQRLNEMEPQEREIGIMEKHATGEHHG